MSESITIARPYAKAIFNLAMSQGALSKWSEYLGDLAAVMTNEDVAEFIANPASTPQQHSELLLTLTAQKAGKDDKHLKSFIEKLAQNKRLIVLPEIVTLYEDMRAEQEKVLTVNVVSYSELSKAQQEKLVTALSNRLERQVILNITLDKALIGGAVINAGDLVIDGSVRGKLNKLKTRLAA